MKTTYKLRQALIDLIETIVLMEIILTIRHRHENYIITNLVGSLVCAVAYVLTKWAMNALSVRRSNRSNNLTI